MAKPVQSELTWRGVVAKVIQSEVKTVIVRSCSRPGRDLRQILDLCLADVTHQVAFDLCPLDGTGLVAQGKLPAALAVECDGLASLQQVVELVRW